MSFKEQRSLDLMKSNSDFSLKGSIFLNTKNDWPQGLKYFLLCFLTDVYIFSFYI